MFSPLPPMARAGTWRGAGHGGRTSGSAPRQDGSHIAVRDDGAFAGSVSAGCVEGAVIEQPWAHWAEAASHAGVRGQRRRRVRIRFVVAAGKIEILVEPIL